MHNNNYNKPKRFWNAKFTLITSPLWKQAHDYTHTVEPLLSDPLLNGPPLSGHPLLNDHLTIDHLFN